MILRLLVIAVAWTSTCALAVCTPDPAYSPTPTYRWDAPPADPDEERIGGYMIRWRWLGDSTWPTHCCMDFLPCQTVRNEDTGETWNLCPGTDYSVALQKYTNDSLQELEVCVESVNRGDPWDAANRSVECVLADQSDAEGMQTVICMPELRSF